MKSKPPIMTFADVMTQLEAAGDAQTKKTLMKHGACEPFFGVKVAELKKDQKNHELSLKLYATRTYVPELTSHAQAAAKKIGKVTVDMNGTACKVPFATDYLQKIIDKGRVGKKRKTARC